MKRLQKGKKKKEFVTQSELRLVTAKVSEMSVQMAGLADRQQKTEQSVENIQKSIDVLNKNLVSDKDFQYYVILRMSIHVKEINSRSSIGTPAVCLI